MRDVSVFFKEFAYSFMGVTSSFFRGASPHTFTVLSSFFSRKKRSGYLSIKWEENRRDVKDLWLGAGHSYVFHGGFGKPLYYTYPSEWWRRFTERQNLKRISLHGLRHTTATILLEKQTD
ncbi:tyrosine-type recombinase/integrase [Paenibacillus sp. 2RAB27]|uniref:tyrosine-type recombinase/integrase n=1 Tax=Paenibacillus sp. 2RAB27 TaxID=3232991 RepID=UPI003F96DF40